MYLAEKAVSTFEFRGRADGAEVAGGLDELFGKRPVEHFHAGAPVFHEGDNARHVFEVTEGVLRLFKLLVDGRRVVTGFRFPGNVVGFSQASRFLYGAEAVTDAKVRRVSRGALNEAIENSPEIRPRVFAKLCSEMASAEEQMVLLSCKNAEERLCSFLLSLWKRQESAGSLVALPMSRLDIADYLGLSIETVSRNLTKLAGKGVLSRVERFSLRIIKPHVLEEIAGVWEEDETFCGGYCH